MLLDSESAPARSDADSHIVVRGAREHNLRNVSVDIPRGRFVVITGVSGSGKSTLAFDILFAEGQRRFLDSMNTYARQFVEQLDRPDVDMIAGLPPTVSIEQAGSRGGGKSTVATVTEIHHFIRLLFARLGRQYCPDCQVPVEAQTRDQVRLGLEAETRSRGDLRLLAPVVRNRKGFHSEVAAWAARQGYGQIRANGTLYRTDQPFRLDRFKEHDIEVVVGVLEASAGRRRGKPMQGSGSGKPVQVLVDEALTVGKGVVLALDDDGAVSIHSTERACPGCRRSFAPLDPKHFSYNSSQGWCPRCRGFGELFYLPDVERGANADAIEESWWGWQEGKRELCPECKGARLRPEARAVRLEGADMRFIHPGRRGARPPFLAAGNAPTIDDIARASVDDAAVLFRALSLEGRAATIGRDILPEIRERLKFLGEVGLGYLQLGRGVTTLSGGEGQRIRLAAQLGSNLSGVLYVLDEPTIGLHSRDNDQLLAALTALRDRGNSLVVVEHDEETMRKADFVVDLGPGAGIHGGRVVASGTLGELVRNPASVTGQCLKVKSAVPGRGSRRPVRPVGKSNVRRSGSGSGDGGVAWLRLEHARVHNLKDVTLEIPLGRFVVVTGVSGSGKSTLIKECLLPAVTAALAGGRGRGGARAGVPGLTGMEAIRSVHEVDQSPIGRTPRSTPATYVGFFDGIRELFAQVPEARMRGWSASRFSFNSKQGRCPRCEGAGFTRLEMNFLPTAHVKCDLCHGARFNPETLDVRYNGKSIADVLDLSVAEALDFFGAVPRLRRALEALRDTGLDYLRLGQTSPTLSGGEAQRLKLVSHLLGGLAAASRALGGGPARGIRPGKPDLFILEEPTIGLHFQDVRRLVDVIQRLVDAGHTVVVIEHQLDLIAEADWVIDLGPEAGDAGGTIVVEGTPETVARHAGSHTGRYLAELLRQAGGGG